MIRTFDYRSDGGFSITTDELRAMDVLRECNLIITYDPLDENTYTVHGTKPNTTKAIRALKRMMDEK
jgi:hypothetical protein